MSQLFLPTTDGFEIQLLEAEGYALSVGDAALPAAQALASRADASADSLLLRVAELPDAPGAGWALLAGRAARVLLNGEPVVLGLALLRHRDELRLDGAEPLYFSTERLAAIEPCARDDAPRCLRCAQPIVRDEMAVRCPGCGVLYHERPDRNCWTYLERCGLCEQATALDADFRWTPEAL